MTILDSYPDDHRFPAIAALDKFIDAGIDPAFDAEMDELDRQFAELRLTFND